MKYILCIIILIACVCDKARDKYHANPQWRTRYPRLMLVPTFLWRKFQDRWHIAKQVGFLLPLGLLDYLIYWVYGDWILALLMIPVAWLAWDYVIRDPEHWKR